MKYLIALAMIFAFTSCDKLKKVADGAEKLQDGMKNTSEGIRKQKLSESLKVMEDPAKRANLMPVPFDMMAAARTFADAVTAEESVLFFKNYISKINSQQSADVVPQNRNSESDADLERAEQIFQHNRQADYKMLMLVAGFMPDETITNIINNESSQGAYKDIMLAILKLRADFNGDMMFLLSMLGTYQDEKGNFVVANDKIKLDTLGKIQKAIDYNSKVEFICNLEFAENVDVQIAGYGLKPLDKLKAQKNWELLLSRMKSDYKATSFSKDPAKNEAEVKSYSEKYNSLLDFVQKKVDGKKG